MALNLAARPAPMPSQRSIVPACLQPRAPLRYEIRDEDQRRIAPTLAGYMLRHGTTYRLRVTTQDQEANDWKLRLSAKRSLVVPNEKDESDGDARVVTFEAASPKDHLGQLDSAVTMLHVHLDFEDGRDPYRFDVPVVVRAGRSRWLASILISGVLAVLTSFLTREGFAVPRPMQVGVFAALLALLVCGSLLRDHWKFAKRARELAGGN